ncbi:MAG: rhomboid family intramembrane serine protease [Clostridia bacterium]|nr:rhomboid family intramembrane serine protease [Clostridia bacterium]
MKFLTAFLNNGRKNLKWHERNLFFAATLLIIILNIVLYAALGGSWKINTQVSSPRWNAFLYFKALIQTFLNAFLHFNWQHTLLNMLCFAVCGIYLERKTGTLNFFLLILGFAFFTSCAVAANNESINFRGFSGVNFALYSYIILDYLFCTIPKNKRTRLNTVYGGVMLALVYLAMCFSGGTSKFTFSWYPYDLFYNLGHYTSFFSGAIITLSLKLVILATEKKLLRKNDG